MKNSRGFSLLELLIVVAIILIIATIAIPSLLRSRQAANESASVANVRTVNTAEVTYLSSAGQLRWNHRPDYGRTDRLALHQSGFGLQLHHYEYRIGLHRICVSDFYEYWPVRLLQLA